jgi:hypothetical protein
MKAMDPTESNLVVVRSVKPSGFTLAGSARADELATECTESMSVTSLTSESAKVETLSLARQSLRKQRKGGPRKSRTDACGARKKGGPNCRTLGRVVIDKKNGARVERGIGYGAN